MGGGGSNYLCLPEEPQWKNHTDTRPHSGWLYGVEYRIYGEQTTLFSRASFHDKPTPCAVCYVPHRSASIMMPASTNCPVGWTQEYGGYLMSDHTLKGRFPTSYICVDDAPEVASGGVTEVQSILLFVKVGCGTLPCSKYHEGWEVACVVCTKHNALYASSSAKNNRFNLLSFHLALLMIVLLYIQLYSPYRQPQ